jgi:hypothetical protein
MVTVFSASASDAILGSVMEPTNPPTIVSSALNLSEIDFAFSALSLRSVALRSMPEPTSIDRIPS